MLWTLHVKISLYSTKIKQPRDRQSAVRKLHKDWEVERILGSLKNLVKIHKEYVIVFILICQSPIFYIHSSYYLTSRMAT